MSANVPFGVTFSFPVSSPMVDGIAAVLLRGLFGLKTAAVYMSEGLTVAKIAIHGILSAPVLILNGKSDMPENRCLVWKNKRTDA